MTEFDDMTKRILDKLDKIESDIDDICGRLMRVELNLKAHFNEIARRQKTKDKKFYVVIAVMTMIFLVVEVYQNW